MNLRDISISDFPVVMQLPVFWGDQDLFGHVNNTVHFKWFESVRVTYWRQSGMEHQMTPNHWGPILASVSCDYRRQIKYPDTVHVSARVCRIGRTSLTMDHVVYSVTNQQMAATGQSVVVLFDYQQQRPQRITDDIRALIVKLEGRDV